MRLAVFSTVAMAVCHSSFVIEIEVYLLQAWIECFLFFKCVLASSSAAVSGPSNENIKQCFFANEAVQARWLVAAF